MNRDVILKSQAEADLAQAHDWYQQQDMLGDKFLAAVEAAVLRVADGPERFPIIHKKVRRALVRGFPHSIYFLDEPNHIFVLTIVHQRRDPKLWKGRVR